MKIPDYLTAVAIAGITTCANAQVALDNSAFSTLLRGSSFSTNSIPNFDFSKDSNLLVVAVMGETYEVAEVTYNAGTQFFTQVGPTIVDSDPSDRGPNRDLSFWVLSDPVDTSGTDVTLSLDGNTYSGVYFAVFALRNANTSSFRILSDTDAPTGSDLSVTFQNVSFGSFIIDATAQNFKGSNNYVLNPIGPERDILYAKDDFSAGGFISAASNLSGTVTIGGEGVTNEFNTYAALSISSTTTSPASLAAAKEDGSYVDIPEPSNFVLIFGLSSALLAFRRRLNK